MSQVYDYLILGGGIGGLSIGALLAQGGNSVCLVEQNSVVGGYAHTIRRGKYSFCYGVQYLTGCERGGIVRRFLQQIGLASEIQFNALDPKCFDLISINGTKVKIPHGIDNFRKSMVALYPDHAKSLHRYFDVMKHIFNEGTKYEKNISGWIPFLHPIKYWYLLRYHKYTVHDLFEELNLPQEIRAILAGQEGNLSSSPHHASLLMHAGIHGAYCHGAHFPKKGMGFLIDSIVKKILSKDSCKIVTSCMVESIHCNGYLVTHVQTSKGIFHAKNVISNIDPCRTMKLISGFTLPKSYEKRMHYKYSNSVFTVYLGLKNVDLKKYGFGKRNIWHHSLFDLDREYAAEIKRDDFTRPWIFISTPSMNTDEGVVAPKGCHTMELMTFANYDHFRHLADTDPQAFERMKAGLADHLLDIVDKHYLPNIRSFIDVKMIHTPLDVEKMLHSPKGNVYGCSLTPENYNVNCVTSYTPIRNLHLVGATSSFVGIMGVIFGSMRLYNHLISESARQKAAAQRRVSVRTFVHTVCARFSNGFMKAPRRLYLSGAESCKD